MARKQYILSVILALLLLIVLGIFIIYSLSESIVLSVFFFGAFLIYGPYKIYALISLPLKLIVFKTIYKAATGRAFFAAFMILFLSILIYIIFEIWTELFLFRVVLFFSVKLYLDIVFLISIIPNIFVACKWGAVQKKGIDNKVFYLLGTEAASLIATYFVVDYLQCF